MTRYYIQKIDDSLNLSQLLIRAEGLQARYEQQRYSAGKSKLI